MSWLINLKGKRFGRLKVISRLENDNHKQVVWKCLCDCGNVCNIISRSLVHNRTKSCGCLHKDKVRKQPYYHLYSRIIKRTENCKYEIPMIFDDFVQFTKIKICHYCKDSVMWLEHRNPNGTHQYNLDRKDNNIGYTKENCVVCCPRCNQMKRSLSYDDFYKFTRPIRLYKSKKLVKSSNKCDCDLHKHECCDICTGYDRAMKKGTLKDK